MITKWATIGCVIASIALAMTAVPVGGLLGAVQAWIAGLGFWAPLAFAAAYGIAATLFIPGSALSLAAGVLFGVWTGTVVVWLGATSAIVMSFLIARYAARARVTALASTRPRFAAVDRAIGGQGWKIVALMRLSPVFPFSLQNYLFGVTAIRFWPCCLASAACILPGTFLYVYLGYAGSEAATAVGGSSSTDSLKLGLQLVGLVATLVVTVAVARIAARAISEHAPDEKAPASVTSPSAPRTKSTARSAWMLAVAVACLIASSFAFSRRESIRAIILSPRVELVEPDAFRGTSPTFDSGAFDRLDQVRGSWRMEASRADSEGLARSGVPAWATHSPQPSMS